MRNDLPVRSFQPHQYSHQLRKTPKLFVFTIVHGSGKWRSLYQGEYTASGIRKLLGMFVLILRFGSCNTAACQLPCLPAKLNNIHWNNPTVSTGTLGLLQLAEPSSCSQWCGSTVVEVWPSPVATIRRDCDLHLSTRSHQISRVCKLTVRLRLSVSVPVCLWVNQSAGPPALCREARYWCQLVLWDGVPPSLNRRQRMWPPALIGTRNGPGRKRGLAGTIAEF